MKNALKNILAVVLGLVIGSIINMGIIMIGNYVIPLPEGVDTATVEGMKNAFHLLKKQHFIFPFLAHAIGTFLGAFMTSFVATRHKFRMALIVGVLFLLGGIVAAIMIPAPNWFIVLDLTLAYLPMVWIGNKLKRKKN